MIDLREMQAFFIYSLEEMWIQGWAVETINSNDYYDASPINLHENSKHIFSIKKLRSSDCLFIQKLNTKKLTKMNPKIMMQMCCYSMLLLSKYGMHE